MDERLPRSAVPEDLGAAGGTKTGPKSPRRDQSASAGRHEDGGIQSAPPADNVLVDESARSPDELTNSPTGMFSSDSAHVQLMIPNMAVLA